MDYDTVEIPLARINPTDLTYRISTDEDTTALALSISAIGLIHLPCLVKRGSSFTVISGFRRISACRSLGFESLPARLYSPDLKKELYARIAIDENALQRPLNIVEQSRAYQLLLGCSDSESDTRAFAKSVGLPYKKKALAHIGSIAKMPDFLQRSILEGVMAVSVASQLCRWESGDAKLLNDLFKRLSPGLNVQRELLTLLTEISLRDNTPIGQLLQRASLEDNGSEEGKSAPQKLQEIRSHLKKVRFPSLSSREAAFYQTLKSMKIDSRIQTLPPRFFESNTFRVTLNIDSRTQLRSLLPELTKLINHPDFLPE